MERVHYLHNLQHTMALLNKGAFLTVKSNSRVNTMTIGWALIGYIWQKPIFMVAVRPVRHTFSLIEEASSFSVSIPYLDLSKELSYCGSRSGKNVDKFKECSLAVVGGQKIDTPVIATFGLHYECSIIFKSPMDPAHLQNSFHALYPNKDYHTLYFGEIVDCYLLGESPDAAA